ncbi:MAG: pirin family protein [Bacteroidia bacterium]|nr:pirin family protein [Bacteroidia bacterium]
MSKTVIKANTRGHADHGWLKANHSFSFAGYHDDARTHFGALRVLNDDSIAAGMGFGTHPHDNMEIITIPLSGALEHKDSMGNHGVIKSGDVQVMSAGSGIQHSEFNHSKTEGCTLFQIWLFPNKKNVKPRYDQRTLDVTQRKNKFQQVISPNENDEGSWIHQDAWFSMASMDKDLELQYDLKRNGNGIYLMVIEGEIAVEGELLQKRDAIEITDITSIKIKASEKSEILLMDVPMKW